MDHASTQDLDAIRQAARGECHFDPIREDLRREALRILPDDVASGLEAFARPELEPERRRWAEELRHILEDCFTRAPFDAILMPSDTYFYVRAMAEVAHDLGVPFLVAQKETTIAEHTMREHTEALRRWAPPLADHMTVCSDRHKEFWIRAGGDPALVTVTGQPRFDFYMRTSEWPADVPFGNGGPSVLFLSYAVDAYHPDDREAGTAWRQLHEETEQGLYDLARRGWRVLIKPHPLQSVESLREWRRRAGELWERRVFLVSPDTDVRPLIVAADVTVGFQSTALLEAMVAGRPVVYTGWDEQANALGEDLIPFHRWDSAITVLHRASELPGVVSALQKAVFTSEVTEERLRIAEHYLGPLDGRAAERTVAVLRDQVYAWAARRGPAQELLRARLERRRARLRVMRRGRRLMRTSRGRMATTLRRNSVLGRYISVVRPGFARSRSDR